MDLKTPPPVSPNDLDPRRVDAWLRAPTRGGIAFAAGLVAAVLLYCGARAFGKSYSEAFFCSPFFVGAVIGVLGPRHPIRNALYTVLAALVIGILSLREGVICVLFALPLVVPETIHADPRSAATFINAGIASAWRCCWSCRRWDGRPSTARWTIRRITPFTTRNRRR